MPAPVSASREACKSAKNRAMQEAGRYSVVYVDPPTPMQNAAACCKLTRCSAPEPGALGVHASRLLEFRSQAVCRFEPAPGGVRRGGYAHFPALARELSPAPSLGHASLTRTSLLRSGSDHLSGRRTTIRWPPSPGPTLAFDRTSAATRRGRSAGRHARDGAAARIRRSSRSPGSSGSTTTGQCGWRRRGSGRTGGGTGGGTMTLTS